MNQNNKDLPLEEIGFFMNLLFTLLPFLRPSPARLYRRALKAHRKAREAYDARVWDRMLQMGGGPADYEHYMSVWDGANPGPTMDQFDQLESETESGLSQMPGGEYLLVHRGNKERLEDLEDDNCSPDCDGRFCGCEPRD